MQIGIRLHDINTNLSPEHHTMEARAEKAREEGFSCVHLAFSKVMKGVTFDHCALNEGLAAYTRRVFAKHELDVAVLGCYLNLAHPDPDKLRDIQSRYYGHLRVALSWGPAWWAPRRGPPTRSTKWTPTPIRTRR